MSSPHPQGTSTQEPEQEQLDLAISGMTCASCSARVERKLNKLEGVEASVNLATEKAHVAYAAPLTVEDLIATVHKTGYGARVLGGAAPAAAGTTPAESRTTPAESRAAPAESGAAGPAPDGALDLSAADHGHRTGGPARPGAQEHDHLDHEVVGGAALRRRAGVAGSLGAGVLVVAMVPPVHDALGSGGGWIGLLLTTPVYFWAAWPFHRAAAVNARHLASTMDTLVSIGVTAGYAWSTAAVLTGFTDHLYFEVAAVVTAFLLIGRYAESRAKDSGRSALRSLMQLGAKDVAVLRQDPSSGALTEVRLPTEQLQVGMHFVVRPGEKVATDGVVVDGDSAVDTSMVTGESMPVEVTTGHEVTGATVNGHGRLVVQARRVGSETTLAQMTKLVEDAQTGKAPVQRLADRISAVFVPSVLVIATTTFLVWLVTGNPVASALSAAVAVLIIACPCALGLATPTALLVGTGRGAQLGVLIKGPQILESTRRVDTLVLDKTGTVTTGVATLQHITTADRLRKDAALKAAAAVESGSEHPIARAIVEAAGTARIDLPALTGFTNLPGQGARATINGTEVTVGKPGLFDTVPAELEAALAAGTGTTVLVGWDGAARAALTVADEVRDSSPAALQRLSGLGLTAYLLTGDNAQTARTVATQVGIDPSRVMSNVLPQDKHAEIERLQADGKVVAMVGDGVNDAAALAQADLGMAMGSGTDVAMNSADIVLMRADVDTVADAIGLSRRTLRVIKQNLFWAFGYNTAAIPLAAFGLLNPMIAGAAMALSSVLVVANSLRLKSYARR